MELAYILVYSVILIFACAFKVYLPRGSLNQIFICVLLYFCRVVYLLLILMCVHFSCVPCFSLYFEVMRDCIVFSESILCIVLFVSAVEAFVLLRLVWLFLVDFIIAESVSDT